MVTKSDLLIAVRKRCVHCMSGCGDDIENCAAGQEAGNPKCALYKYRTGATSRKASNEKQILSAIKKHCNECAGSENEAIDCTSGGSGGFHKCELYDIRLWAFEGV